MDVKLQVSNGRATDRCPVAQEPNIRDERGRTGVRRVMKRVYLEHIVVDVTPEQRAARELAKLIRKLRWIGMEQEAEQLQTALGRFPSDKRASVLAGPHSTD
jgi:hypothetical protein